MLSEACCFRERRARCSVATRRTLSDVQSTWYVPGSLAATTGLSVDLPLLKESQAQKVGSYVSMYQRVEPSVRQTSSTEGTRRTSGCTLIPLSVFALQLSAIGHLQNLPSMATSQHIPPLKLPIGLSLLYLYPSLDHLYSTAASKTSELPGTDLSTKTGRVYDR